MILLATALLLALAPQAKAESWTRLPTGTTEWTVKSGFPWSGASVRRSLGPRVAALAGVDAALFRRWEAQAGLQIHWVQSPHWAMDSTLALGVVHQTGSVSRQGPQASAVLRFSRTGNIEPYLAFHDRELISLQSTQVLAAGGDSTEWDLTVLHARGGTLGVVFPTRKPLMLELGLQMGSVDSAFAIPSAFAAAHWRPST